MTARRRVRWWWLVAAVVLLVVLGAASSFTHGGCYDSATDPAASFCYSEPMLTVPGMWIGWGLWLAFAAFAAWRAFFAGPIRPR